MQALTRHALLIIVALSMAAMTACFQSDSSSLSCPEGWDRVTEYRLYFGRSDGADSPDAVSDEDWARFLADTVTPPVSRWPDRHRRGRSVAGRVRRGTEGGGQDPHPAGLARRHGSPAVERDSCRIRTSFQPGIGAAHLGPVLRHIQLVRSSASPGSVDVGRSRRLRRRRQVSASVDAPCWCLYTAPKLH